jgi:prepilin-type N-terminal cleavage/methylation domain-containing protein
MCVKVQPASANAFLLSGLPAKADSDADCEVSSMFMPSSHCVYGSRKRRGGFSLVELLAVIAIIAILTVAVTLALPTIMAARNMSNAVDQITNYLNFARSRAIAENTYVLVCFSLPSPTGHTDLQMLSYSSVNGTYTPGSTPATQLGKVAHVPNVSLCTYANLGASATAKLSAAGISGTDATSSAQPTTVDCLANIAIVPMLAPPGSSATSGPNAFAELIAFSPQGEVILVPASGTAIGPTTPYYNQIFIGICPARNGTAITGNKNSSALLLDGGSGHVTPYRS